MLETGITFQRLRKTHGSRVPDVMVLLSSGMSCLCVHADMYIMMGLSKQGPLWTRFASETEPADVLDFMHVRNANATGSLLSS